MAQSDASDWEKGLRVNIAWIIDASSGKIIQRVIWKYVLYINMYRE